VASVTSSLRLANDADITIAIGMAEKYETPSLLQCGAVDHRADGFWMVRS
jgi:hypothetical protein